MADARCFATGSNLCWPCYQDSKMLTCNRCNIPKQRREYDSQVLSNAIKSGRLLVCLECYKLGYSAYTPHGITSFDCAGGHKCGHLAFDNMKFQNVLKNHTSKTRKIYRVLDRHALPLRGDGAQQPYRAEGAYGISSCHKYHDN